MKEKEYIKIANKNGETMTFELIKNISQVSHIIDRAKNGGYSLYSIYSRPSFYKVRAYEHLENYFGGFYYNAMNYGCIGGNSSFFTYGAVFETEIDNIKYRCYAYITHMHNYIVCMVI